MIFDTISYTVTKHASIGSAEWLAATYVEAEQTAPACATAAPPPPPIPAAEPLRVERRVSCRGALVVARQRIHGGIIHTGRTLAVEAANTTWRIHDDDEVLVAEAPRTTTKPVARFKIHKPEPPARPPRKGIVRPGRCNVRHPRPRPTTACHVTSNDKIV